MYHAYHEVDTDADAYDSMMHAPLLLSTEQDALLKGLRKVGFFESFAFDAQRAEWVAKAEAAKAARAAKDTVLEGRGAEDATRSPPSEFFSSPAVVLAIATPASAAQASGSDAAKVATTVAGKASERENVPVAMEGEGEAEVRMAALLTELNEAVIQQQHTHEHTSVFSASSSSPRSQSLGRPSSRKMAASGTQWEEEEEERSQSTQRSSMAPQHQHRQGVGSTGGGAEYMYVTPAPSTTVLLHAVEGDPSESQLTLGADERVEVLDTDEATGWCWVRSSVSGAEGYVPQSYLKGKLLTGDLDVWSTSEPTRDREVSIVLR